MRTSSLGICLLSFLLAGAACASGSGGQQGAGGSAGTGGSGGTEGPGGGAGAVGGGGEGPGGGGSGSTGGGGGNAGGGGSAGPSALWISEVYVDRDLDGNSVEWIEIGGEPGTSLDGVKVRHYRYESAENPAIEKFDIAIAPQGTVIPGSGVWTVGGAFSDALHTVAIGAPDNFGLDNSSGTLQLYRQSNSKLLDALGYGDATPSTAPSPPTTTMFGTAVTLPSSGTTTQTVARIPGEFSNDNASDFCRQIASPNATNDGICK